MSQAKEKRKAYHTAYRERNKEKLKAYYAERYKKNREKYLKKMKEYYRDNRNEKLKYAKKYRNAYPEKIRDRHYRREYGITLEQFEQIFLRQNSKCANIQCLSSSPQGKKGWQLDHDHSTGNVREILCCKCNLLLGCANDNIPILEGAIEYLNKWKKSHS